MIENGFWQVKRSSSDQEQPLNQLISAIRKGNFQLVCRLAGDVEDINAFHRHGFKFSSMMYAAENGYTEIVEELYRRGASLEGRKKELPTPLILAARNGHIETVECLCKLKANLQGADGDGRTALSWAASEGRTGVIQTLLDMRADILFTDFLGRTPLVWTLLSGQKDIAQIFIEHGVNTDSSVIYIAKHGCTAALNDLMSLKPSLHLNVIDESGKSAVMWAAFSGYVDTVRTLLDLNADVDRADNDGFTAIVWASKESHLDIVRHIQERGVDLNQYLHRAISQDQAQAVKEYCSLGADIEEALDGSSLKPLIKAINDGKISAAKQLRMCGAKTLPCIVWAVERGRCDHLLSLDEIDELQLDLYPEIASALLESAVQNRHFDVVLLLHELKASLHHRLRDGCTTLIHAADRGLMNAVTALIELRADIDCGDSCGRTALDGAAYRGATSSVQTLLGLRASLGGPGRSALIEAAKRGHPETAGRLLSIGGNDALGLKDEYGCTPLMWAAGYGNTAVVELLLEKRARLEDTDDLGRTAIMWAAKRGYDGTVCALCTYGADIQAEALDGSTALTYASSIGSVDTVHALLANRADSGHHDGRCCAALVAAIRQGHAQIAKLLYSRTGVEEKDKSAALLAAAESGHGEIVMDLFFAWGVRNADYCLALIAAAGVGNTKTVRLLHALGAGIDSRDSLGCTALMWSASEGHIETVKSLLSLGAATELCDNEGMTAMQWAALCSRRGADVMEALQSSGADVKYCLAWASRSRLHTDMLRLLCSLGASVNACDADGVSPLGWALENDHSEAALVLLELGANGGATLLQAACAGRVETVRLAIEIGISPNVYDETGVPALVCAIRVGQMRTATLLSRAGTADLSLLWAAKTGSSTEIIDALATQGGSVNAKDGEGRSALGWAVLNGHDAVALELHKLGSSKEQCLLWASMKAIEGEVQKLLLIFKDAIQARDEHGRTAIMLAVSNSCTASLLLTLLKAGAQQQPPLLPDTEDDDKCTALGHALLSRHDTAVKILLAHGADICQCLEFAARRGAVELVTEIMRINKGFKFVGAKGEQIFNAAAEGGNVSILQELYNLGVGDCNQHKDSTHKYCTALMLAAENGREEAVRQLLAFGARVNGCDHDGVTALMCAARKGHRGCVEELVRSGASIKARDTCGLTPLIWASKFSMTGTVQTLCALRANIDAADKDGLTALMVAARQGHVDTVAALCDLGASLFLCCQKGLRAALFAEMGSGLAGDLEAKESAAAARFRSKSNANSSWIWACCVESGLAGYSLTDSVALELKHANIHQAVHCSSCIVRVVPDLNAFSIWTSNHYFVDVEKMTQQNLMTNTVRKVVRFPSPLTALIKAFGDSDPTQSESESAKLVRLNSLDEEHTLIEHLFSDSGRSPPTRILAIHRVQNMSQFTAFRHRTHRLRAACGDEWDETRMVLWLFHGTSDEAMDEIINDNVFGFKPLMCQRTSFGKGTYFAKRASYSISFCSPQNGYQKRIIVAAVAVGHSALGMDKDLFPPKGFHSFVNDMKDPSIFVIPDGASAYPAYVITFQ